MRPHGKFVAAVARAIMATVPEPALAAGATVQSDVVRTGVMLAALAVIPTPSPWPGAAT